MDLRSRTISVSLKHGHETHVYLYRWEGPHYTSMLLVNTKGYRFKHINIAPIQSFEAQFSSIQIPFYKNEAGS